MYCKDEEYDEAVISTDEEETDSFEGSHQDHCVSNVPLFSFFRNILNQKKFKCNRKDYETVEADNIVTSNANASSSRRRILHKSKKFQQRMLNLSIPTYYIALNIFSQCLKVFGKIIFMNYFLLLLVAKFSFSSMSNSVEFLKCYTESQYVYNIPLNLCSAIFKDFVSFINTTFTKKGKGNYFELHQNRKTFCVLLVCLLLLLLFCYSKPNPRICTFLPKFNNLKLKILENSHAFFLFPGEDCIRACQCCKGYLEGLFRWLSCFVTIPIRIILSTWSKSPENMAYVVKGLYNMDNYIEVLSQDINQIKDDIYFQEETLNRIQKDFINLELEVTQKTNSIKELKLKISRPTKHLDKIKTEMLLSWNLLKKALTIRNDADKMIIAVKTNSQESASFVSATLFRIHESIKSQHQELEAQINPLESFLQEEQSKIEKENMKVLVNIQNEVDSIANVYNQITIQIAHLLHLQIRFKEQLYNLHKDFHSKLDEKRNHHEQMSKMIETTCSMGTENLQNNLKAIKTELKCFIIKTVNEYMTDLYDKLREDIRNTLQEKIIEFSQTILKYTVANKIKSQIITSRPPDNDKGYEYFPNMFEINGNIFECLKDKIMINTSELCNNTYLQLWSVKTNRLKDIIDKALELLKADNIGMADFALETSGGVVLAKNSSPSYAGKSTLFSRLGFNFGKVIKSIRKIIQPHNLPGECWAFPGQSGHVVIRLTRPVALTAVTIDHVSRLLTPDGEIRSAPNLFHIYIVKDLQDTIEIKIGEFAYNKDGNSIQTFYLEKISPVTQFIKFKFLSNHGNDEYTCIYRLRVHGNLPPG